MKRYKLSVGTASTGGQEASFRFSQSPLIFFLPRARSVSLIGSPCYPSGILRSRVLADPGCQRRGPGLCGDGRWAPPSAPRGAATPGPRLCFSSAPFSSAPHVSQLGKARTLHLKMWIFTSPWKVEAVGLRWLPVVLVAAAAQAAARAPGGGGSCGTRSERSAPRSPSPSASRPPGVRSAAHPEPCPRPPAASAPLSWSGCVDRLLSPTCSPSQEGRPGWRPAAHVCVTEQPTDNS